MSCSWFRLAMRMLSVCKIRHANGSKDNLAEALELAKNALSVIQSWLPSDNNIVIFCEFQCNLFVCF